MASDQSADDRSHPAYSLPNYSRLFREAVGDSVRDYARQNPEVLVPGYWLIRYGRDYPRIPAKIFWCAHAPDDPSNKLERPFLAAEIAGEMVDPVAVYAAAGGRQDLVPQDGLTVEQEYQFLVAKIRHARAYLKDDPYANPRRKIVLTKIPPIPPPVRSGAGQ